MKALFDTSALVAAILTGHEQHQPCLTMLKRAQAIEIEGAICAHSLAELYSALTRIPQTKVSPALAQSLLSSNLQSFEIVALLAEDYISAIELMVQNQLPGGGIFDALIAQAALKSQVDILVTLNPKHFARLGDLVAEKVYVPQ
jgi:predicted nucleic acid-binding protein